MYTHQFSSVQSLSRVRLFAIPWIAAHRASLPITNSQRDANKHKKRRLTPVIVKEMQIKTTVRYHLTQVWMTIIKKIYKQ